MRDIGGYLVALAWSMANIYDVKPGETFWTASDIGWVVGHSYIVYAPLIHGCDGRALRGQAGRHAGRRRVLARHQRIQGRRLLHRADRACAPCARRTRRRSSLQKYDLSAFRTLFLAGERADPDTVAWAEKVVQRPIVDHWWQTETGWPIAANPVGHRAHADQARLADGRHARLSGRRRRRRLPARFADGVMGSIVIKLPLPPGCLPTLYRQDERMRESYLSEFPGYYKTSDAGDEGPGRLSHHPRPHRRHHQRRRPPALHRRHGGGGGRATPTSPNARCSAIKDAIKGEQPCGFLVLKAGVSRPHDEIEQEVVALVRDRIGPVAAFKTAIVVARLPKTRSGKILRGTMKKIADEDPWSTPATIEDPAALDEVAAAIRGRGVGS